MRAHEIRLLAFRKTMNFVDGIRTYQDLIDAVDSLKLSQTEALYYMLTVGSFLTDSQELELRIKLADTINTSCATKK